MKKIFSSSVLVATMCLCGHLAVAQDKATRPQPDNSSVNKADRGDTKQTAQGQSQAKADRELAAAVRKSIVSDKSLSTYAHNIKVIATNGTVTLRGPVRSSSEKAKVAELAQQVPDVQTVDNRVTVKAAG
jgi:osmotically-inducible protein OsmY